MKQNHLPKVHAVDDNTVNIELVNRCLNNEYQVSTSLSGAEAIEAIKKIQPHLVLLDIMMPEMDGFEVARILKQNDSTREIPIIFLTAKTDTESITQGFELGGTDYIIKPFNLLELKARVKTHAHKRIQQVYLHRLLKDQSESLIKTNQELAQAFSKINKLNSSRDLMIEQVSHILRTPLTSILGYAEALGDLAENKQLKSFAEIIVRESDKLSHTIDNIMGDVEKLTKTD
ncbi:MAG: response regulator [Deltaproteobacteria bacterium]|nr:response regulator [Deltaproteobacteria bacterium]